MVYLVGAGSGSAGLITLAGLDKIKSADVIIFDNLINLSLLNYASDDCELIYAGKSSGNHHLAQEETNALMVKYAREGKTVVRLKGGDPMVFGRGGEEAQYLRENDLPFELIAGVSSCFAAAEYAGIPVTHRNAASSFHVITGHEKNEHIDYAVLAKEEGTLVFLMGLKNLPEIVQKLIKNGKNPKTPAAIISNGTLKTQQCVTGILSDIAKKAEGLPFPAVIIVGDVTDKRVEWFLPEGKLSGIKIVSTATRVVSADFKAEAEKHGGELTEVSLIKITPINYDKFRKINLADFSHIVFTSANGVKIFFDYLRQAKIDLRSVLKAKFAVIGERTARALSEYGIYADLMPGKYDSESLAALLKIKLTPFDNVLLARAETASKSIPDTLRKSGIPYTELALYRAETNYRKAEAIRLAVKDADYVIVSSPSAARAFFELAAADTQARLISIGEHTTEAAEKCGLRIYKTAQNADAKSVINSILEDMT